LVARYYAQRASAGLTITEGVFPTALGKGYVRTPGIETTAQIAAWQKVAEAVPVIVKLLVACECIQAARLRLFSAEAISTGFLSGFRCTTSIRDQFRRGPAQRWGAR